MRFEMYVRHAELGEIFENIFGLFDEYLVSVQCTQTHVVLSEEREAERRERKKKTSIFLHELERKGAETKNGRTSTDLHPVKLAPLVPSSRAVPQLIAMKPGDWRDSMRYVRCRIIS